MSQRLVAAIIALPAILVLFVYALINPLPFATYEPGETFNVLGSDPDGGGADVIQVSGHKTYPDEGQLRMTTVRVSPAAPVGKKPGENLFSLLGRWFDSDDAVWPYEVVHPEGDTPEKNQEEGQIQMTTSQDAAVEVALSDMGIKVPQVIQVSALTEGKPAAAVLKVGDVIRTISGTKVDSSDQLVTLITKAPAGKPLTIGITRAGKKSEVEVSPVSEDGRSVIGISPAIASYDFPFDVSININPLIGGPSAGLIFSLAVYDTLTPGTLTGGHKIAGTGEIFPNGAVGPIGGIQQKIAGARDQDVELFIVPIDNCAEALKADNGDMRLMMATTMHDVRVALQAYAADEDATLPSCEDAPKILAEEAQ